MSGNATQDLELSVDSYATLGEINAVIPLLKLDGTSRPSRAQAVMIARTVKSSIDSLLGIIGYTVAIQSGSFTSIGYVKHMQVAGTAAHIEAAANSGNLDKNSHADFLMEEYKMLYKQLADGKVTLIDAPQESNAVLRGNEQDPSGKFDLRGGTSETASEFTKSMQF